MNLIVHIPLLGQKYEFVADDNKTVGTMIDEVAEIICEKDKLIAPESFGMMICANKRTKKFLARQQTLIQAELKEGDEIEIV